MKRKANLGLTLLEILLVMVVVASVTAMLIGYIHQRVIYTRANNATFQILQIESAGITFFSANNFWPSSLSCLQGLGPSPCGSYLPATLTVSPYGTVWSLRAFTSPLSFYVSLTVTNVSTAYAEATMIAKKLPFAYVTPTDPSAGPIPAPGVCAGTCYVVSPVIAVPTYLNNASKINFAGLFRHGGCVPKPVCPVDNAGVPMTAQIFLLPVSVSGVNDNYNLPMNVYPLTSYTAYAVGGTNNSPPYCNGFGSNGTTNCSTGPDMNGPPVTTYWRACMQVVTSKGNVASTRNDPSPMWYWGQNVTMAAFTRCASTSEPGGSTFNVYGN